MPQDPTRNLPYITFDLPGVGGEIKREPAHFEVSELPLYLPQGHGPHLYLTLERRGMATREVQQGLSRAFGLKESDIGYAGLKDKQAVVRQTFSLALDGLNPEQAAERAEKEMPVKVLEASRHQNKLKVGHLLGNRFRIRLCGPEPDSQKSVQNVASALKSRGVANFFGPQRFGRDGDNAAQGRRLISGELKAKKWKRKLFLSAFQSELFNAWLAARIKDGLYSTLIAGDVAKKNDTGGLFLVEDPEAEQPRFDERLITYTGPIFGKKMKPAGHEALARELETLNLSGVSLEELGGARLSGGRRRAVLAVDDLSIEPCEGGFWFSFSLPKGSYATSLMREFIKPAD